ncbi:hypothetical protein L210DRAFT_959612 [Boletus edulis BED1]|uniref:4a-hydroxytetrahydrobiopterin dehydratase n=1 Tax=Boletus edulis BED1 TaxID=1328754 RepID=A0AAD4GIU9_BOLED|nr:hypothetical protein L210DRAFT_959612 [Boletus edulis BED1]
MDELPSGACQGAATLDDAVSQSADSPDVQKFVPELPEVARIPTKKRIFHLDHEDFETHVRPLLSCHWHVGRIGNVVDDLQVLSLNKLFSFKNFRSAVEFFDALAAIQDEEDHHARVTVDYAHVYVSTHTHVAYQRISDADSDGKPIKVPGLTVRDIRFAVKVEKLHEGFLADGRAVTKVPVDAASLQAWSMGQLRRRYPTSHG